MRTATCLLLLLSVCLTGCGKGDQNLPAQPTGGQVLYDDKPAEGVQVFFLPMSAMLPKEAKGNPHGVTDANGRFTVSTPGLGEGAPEGGYRVILLWPDETKAEHESLPDKLFGWYDAKHTKLEVEVKAGTNDLPAFKLPVVTGPPPASQGIPGRN